ncbi:hypothetical protein [uncultured Lamprocystis sp.]|jgi:hypothetical protein|uniref:hypothetical protein n=1 Tax=uncultured Lamprocystis sp. TaxID=543132 RepID=UPI0025EBB5C5|nr:hypothetical protein [uncultured Lamprocystis sp.]
MTATLLVFTAAAIAVLAVVLLAARLLWWLALPALILALLAMVAEGPHAAAEIWGERLPGVVAATQSSVQVETARARGARTSHLVVRHRFGAIVCYRAPDAPGLGAGTPIDPAILAAVGEPLSAADQRCWQAPGSGILRQTQVRLDEAAFDAAVPGQEVMLRRLRPFGWLEWTWPVDAPLLPMVPRPRFGSDGPRVAVPAQVMAITIDRKGRGLLSRWAQPYAVPVAWVRLRYVPPGHPDGVEGVEGVEGVDQVDAPSVSGLAPGSAVRVTVAAEAPRAPWLVGVERTYWWRNVLVDALTIIGLLSVALIVVGVRKRRRRGT